MALFLYRFFIGVFDLLQPILLLFIRKLKLRHKELKTYQQKLEEIHTKHPDKTCIWIHAASLGEFEQGRPIIDELYDKNYLIILSFNSPSGYEIRKEYNKTHAVVYLPLDTYINAKKFINTLKPDIAIFIKYEFWWNYLTILSHTSIPVYYISTVFRDNHYFFKPLFYSFLNILKKTKVFFVQDEQSLQIAQKYNLNAILSGDTRLDNVIKRALSPKKIDDIETLLHTCKKRVFIYGSIWKEDIIKIKSFIEKDSSFLHIIVPHDVSQNSINTVKKTLTKKTELYGDGLTNFSCDSILIIDKIGILFDLYQYADIAYIGGGFGKGIHNILEPIAFNIPVIFGPNYQKFVEAKEAISLGFGRTFNDYNSFKISLKYLDLKQAKVRESIKNWKSKKRGATNQIIGFIENKTDVKKKDYS